MSVSGRKAQTELSSNLLHSSGEDYEIFCQPCDRDDIRLQAFGFCTDCEEHLCESCFNHHKRATPSLHHTLLDKQNMPQTLQIPSQSIDAGQLDDLTTPCPEHKKEKIKFYCHNHKALLCSVCVTLDHPKTSCKVNYIPDISKQSLSSKEYKDSLQHLDTITEKYQKRTADLKGKIIQSNKSLKDVLADIKKFRQEINQRLDKLEKEAEAVAKALQQGNDTILKAAETMCHDILTSLKASSDSIKQLNNSKQADKLFMELKSAKKLIEDAEENFSLLSVPENVKEFNFHLNQAIISTLQEQKSLGSTTLKATQMPTLNPVPVRLATSSEQVDVAERSPKFSHNKDICVKTSQDKQKCWITGMDLLTPSKLILTDYNNSSIKMVDLNKNSITDQLQLETDPGDITSVTSDQAAVTLPNMKSIQFISVSSNKLSLKHKLKVEGLCIGISCYHEKLVVAFLSQSKVQILNLKGEVLTTITSNTIGEDLFQFPYYVTSNSHSIYVSDERRQAVTRLNWHGELIASYGGMGTPEGLTMAEEGFILVCDWDDIHHISNDLTKDSVVLQDLKRPWAICWCGTNRKLYISYNNLDEKDDNSIQVFKML